MRILVIRLGAIGDVILTSAVLRCLRAAKPEAEIHFLIKRRYAPLLADCKYIDTVVCHDSFKKTLKLLRNADYDYIVDLQRNMRTILWRMLLRKPSSVLHKCNLRKWLITSPLHIKANVPHVALRYIEAAGPLGAADDGRGLELFTVPDSPQLPSEPYIAVAFGAAHATKRIPPEGVLQICRSLNCPVILLGDRGDAETFLKSGITLPPNVDNRCGITSFEETVAIVSSAAVVITPDTGLMHVAAAAGRPVVAVWGSTSPMLGFAPFRTEYTNMEVPLPCRPCGKLGFDRCPKRHFRCMLTHDWQKIAEVALTYQAASRFTKNIKTLINI